MFGSYHETEKGLQNLKIAFLMFLITSATVLIPFVSAIGAIFSFVGLIFLIMGWRALGRSLFSESANYKSTGRWMISVIISVIVVGIIGSIVSTVVIFEYLVSHPISSQPPNGTTNPFGFFSVFGVAIGTITLIVNVLWASALYEMKKAMSKLAIEVAEPRIERSGALYFYQIIVVLVTAAITSYSSFAGTLPFQNLSFTDTLFGSNYFYLLTGNPVLALLGVLGIFGAVLGVLASYYGASGVESALKSGITSKFSTPMPPPPPSSVQSIACPNCGKSFSLLNAAFCPNCGAKLNAPQVS